jgi:macrolide transport system ATP-binding/permease protein
VLSIALGIGLNSTLFTFFNAIFFRPLDIKEPGRVTKLFTRFVDSSDSSLSSYPAFEDYRAQNRVYNGLAAHASFVVNLYPSTSDNTVRRAYLYAVSANFFSVLGLSPSLGRDFRPEEDRSPGAHPVAILSENCWRREFGADPEIVGRAIKLNDATFTVAGVGPPSFLSLDLGARRKDGCDTRIASPPSELHPSRSCATRGRLLLNAIPTAGPAIQAAVI